MKQTIRENAFETNSSSSHTICISNTAKLPLLEELQCNVDLSYKKYGHFDDYGSGDVLRTAEDKLAYLFRYELGYFSKDPNNRDWNPDAWKQAQRVIEKYHNIFPKCNFHIEFDDEEGCPIVSINHQSQDSIIMNRVTEDKELMRWFLSDACEVHLLGDGDDDRELIFGPEYRFGKLQVKDNLLLIAHPYSVFPYEGGDFKKLTNYHEDMDITYAMEKILSPDEEGKHRW